MEKHPFLDFTQFLCLLVAFFFFGNGELTNTSSILLYYLPYVLSLVSLGISLLLGEQKISRIIPYRAGFILIAIISLFYAIHFDYAFIGVKGIALTSIVMFAIAFEVLNRENGFERIAAIFVLSAICNMIFVLSTVDLAELAEKGERLGQTSVGSKWNANSIGLSAFYAFVLTVFLWQSRYRKIKTIAKPYSLFALAFSGLFLTVIILSGSRKVLIAVAALIGIGIFCGVKASFPVKFFTAAAFGIIIVTAFRRIPALYLAIGYRFDSFLAYFGIGDVRTDFSTVSRFDMIEFGLKEFPKRPFLGNGINCYQVLYGEKSGWTVYAHNNYIELLVDLGLIGLLTYYLFFYIQLFRKSSGRSARFFRVLLLILLMLDIGMVSYSEPLEQSLLTLSACALERGRAPAGSKQIQEIGEKPTV